jgi:hypothetical protein
VATGQVADGSLTGADIAPNSLTAGAYSARVNGLTSGSALFASPSGTSAPVAANPTPVYMVSPAVALKATDLSVFMTTAPSPGTRTVQVFVNGDPSVLSCTVVAGSDTCTGSAVAQLPASSELSLRFENSGTVSDTDALVSFRLTGP